MDDLDIVGDVALTALLVALGCPPEKMDAAVEVLAGNRVPYALADIYHIAKAAVDQVR